MFITGANDRLHALVTRRKKKVFINQIWSFNMLWQHTCHQKYLWLRHEYENKCSVIQYQTHQFPECNNSNPSLTCSNFITWDTNSSSWIFLLMYWSTSCGTLSRDFQPPNAEPVSQKRIAINFKHYSLCIMALPVLTVYKTLLLYLYQFILKCWKLNLKYKPKYILFNKYEHTLKWDQER